MKYEHDQRSERSIRGCFWRQEGSDSRHQCPFLHLAQVCLHACQDFHPLSTSLFVSFYFYLFNIYSGSSMKNM